MAVKQTTAGRIMRMLQAWTSGESGQISGQGSHDIGKYNKLHDENHTSVDGRNASYIDLVNSYYNLATDFYEWGWGQSFHFAERVTGAMAMPHSACYTPHRRRARMRRPRP